MRRISTAKLGLIHIKLTILITILILAMPYASLVRGPHPRSFYGFHPFTCGKDTDVYYYGEYYTGCYSRPKNSAKFKFLGGPTNHIPFVGNMVDLNAIPSYWLPIYCLEPYFIALLSMGGRFRAASKWFYRLGLEELVAIMAIAYAPDFFRVENGIIVSSRELTSPPHLGIVELWANISGYIIFAGYILVLIFSLQMCCLGQPAAALPPRIAIVFTMTLIQIGLLFLSCTMFILSVLIFGFLWTGPFVFNTIAICFIVASLSQFFITDELERRWPAEALMRDLLLAVPQLPARAEAGERAEERSFPIAESFLINEDDERPESSSRPRSGAA